MSFALVAAASFLPDVRLWGINHLAFYPLPVRIAALASIALAFVPPVARYLHTYLCGIARALENLTAPRFRTVAFVIALAATTFFFLYRSSTQLLGDGQLISRSFEAAAAGNDQVIMRSVGAIVGEEHIAPGATLLYFVAAQWATSIFGKSPVDGIRVFNCLLGGLYVFLLLTLVRRARIPHALKAWLLVLGLFSAAIELYFGYVENYTPLVFFLFLYVVAGLLFFHRRVGIGWPVAMFIVAGYTHVQSWVFGPSLVFLVIWRIAKGRRRLVNRLVPPVLIGLTLLGVAAGYFTGARRYLLPLYSSDTYSVFSASHLADVANELLLLVPFLPLLIVLAWVTHRMWARVPPAEKKRVRGEPLARPEEWRFVTLMLVPSLAYLFVFTPEIGMARDWDLFGMLNVVLTPLILLMLSRYVSASGIDMRRAACFATPALLLTMVLGVAWFGINASKWRTAERFESVLQYDRAHGSYAWENLAIFYHDNGRLERATSIMEHAYQTYRNPRHAVRVAMYYEEVGRAREAAQLMYNVLERHPRDSRARTKLIMTLEAGKRWADMVPVARDGTRYHPTKPTYHFYLGESLYQTGQVEEALESFRRCLEYSPPTSARAHIGRRLAESEKPNNRSNEK